MSLLKGRNAQQRSQGNLLDDSSESASESDAGYSATTELPAANRGVQRIKETYLPVADVQHDPDNFRLNLTNIPQMKASIVKKGDLIQALGVVPVHSVAGVITHYVCRVGNRRLAAYKELAAEDPTKFSRVRVVIISDGNGMDEAIMSNTQIEPLSATERARAYSYLHDVKGYSDAEIGHMFNLTRQTINAMRNNIAALEAGAGVYDVTHGRGAYYEANASSPIASVRIDVAETDVSTLEDANDSVGEHRTPTSPGNVSDERTLGTAAIPPRTSFAKQKADRYRPWGSFMSYTNKQLAQARSTGVSDEDRDELRKRALQVRSMMEALLESL